MRKLVVYTSFSFLLDTFDLALRERYRDDHFHIITFRDHPQRVLQHIKKEVEVGVPTADIVIGPHWLVLDLQLNGLLRPYYSQEFDAYPKRFYDPKGAWAAMALSPVGLAYNTDLVRDVEAPSSLEDSISERWRGKLAVHSIVENSEGRMGLAYLTTLSRIVGPKRWSRLVDRLADLKPKAYECMPEMALAIGKGEKHLGLPATLACISYYLDIQNRPIAHRVPNDIPYLATFSPSIALVAGGGNPEVAERCFDYALSEDWQQRVEGFSGKIPSRPGVASSSIIPEDAEYFPTLEDAANHQKYLEILKERLY